jgi:hypothetical protein
LRSASRTASARSSVASAASAMTKFTHAHPASTYGAMNVAISSGVPYGV